jgi:hypothetical protein
MAVGAVSLEYLAWVCSRTAIQFPNAIRREARGNDGG